MRRSCNKCSRMLKLSGSNENINHLFALFFGDFSLPTQVRQAKTPRNDLKCGSEGWSKEAHRKLATRLRYVEKNEPHQPQVVTT